MLPRMVYVIIFLLPLMACESLTDAECQRGDWYGIGISDGENGRSTKYIENHREACADVGVTPNRSKWLSGREVGLRQYCTPENAYSIGQAGETINNVCSRQERARMTKPFLIGQQYYNIAEQISELEDEKDTLELELDYAKDDSEKRHIRREIRRTNRKIEDLETRQTLFTLIYALSD